MIVVVLDVDSFWFGFFVVFFCCICCLCTFPVSPVLLLLMDFDCGDFMLFFVVLVSGVVLGGVALWLLQLSLNLS